jgi:hypothetical protein
LAKLIHEDISSYGELGFEGLISCQGQRVFSPSSLGMNVMAQTLWNKNADFEKICDEVLAAEYGDADSDVKSFIKDMSTYSLPSVARLETPLQAQEAKKAYTTGKNRAREFIALTENRTYSHGDDGIKSLSELRIYAEILEKLFEVYIGICEGEDRAALWNGLEDFVNRKENLLKGRFDAFEFKSTLKKIIRQLSSKI